MTDAEGRIIPIVEDDQGEGVKDMFEQFNFLEQQAKALMVKEVEKTVDERLAEIQDKLDALHMLIMRTFGNHILINGRWVDLTNETVPKKQIAKATAN